MRPSNLIVSLELLALAVGLSPAVSFDGTRTPEGATVAVPLQGPGSDFNPGANPPGSATPLAAVPIAPITIPTRRAAPATPLEAFRSGTQALRQGKTHQALAELEYAADQGVAGAIWKLGRMYADGDGVSLDRARAYEYFRRLTMIYGGDSVGTPNVRYVSNAFVTLGQYYMEGIPERWEPEARRARGRCG